LSEFQKLILRPAASRATKQVANLPWEKRGNGRMGRKSGLPSPGYRQWSLNGPSALLCQMPQD
jgi:hypothetical protein